MSTITGNGNLHFSPQPVGMALAGTWIVISALSTYWAELTIGSAPLAMSSVAGLLLTFPLYGLHLLILGGWALRRGGCRLIPLYLSGVVFGLYESYITKVLWNPPWNPHPLRVGGVAALEFLLLVFFWHPIMAFVIPALTAEALLTRSRTLYSQISVRLRSLLEKPRNQILLGIALGAIQGAMDTHATVLPAILSSLILIFAFAWLLRHQSGRFDCELVDLMPSGRLLPWMTILMLFYYPVGIRFIYPERLPGFGAQLTIWISYAIFGWLLLRSFRRYSLTVRPQISDDRTELPARPLLRFLFPAILSALVFSFAPQWLRLTFYILIWAAAIPAGCRIFYLAARWTFGSKPAAA